MHAPRRQGSPLPDRAGPRTAVPLPPRDDRARRPHRRRRRQRSPDHPRGAVRGPAPHLGGLRAEDGAAGHRVLSQGHRGDPGRRRHRTGDDGPGGRDGLGCADDGAGQGRRIQGPGGELRAAHRPCHRGEQADRRVLGHGPGTGRPAGGGRGGCARRGLPRQGGARPARAMASGPARRHPPPARRGLPLLPAHRPPSADRGRRAARLRWLLRRGDLRGAPPLLGRRRPFGAALAPYGGPHRFHHHCKTNFSSPSGEEWPQQGPKASTADEEGAVDAPDDEDPTGPTHQVEEGI